MLFADVVNTGSPEYRMGFLLGGLTVGVLCRLMPIRAGFQKDQPLIGVIGFFACVASGFMCGLLGAIPSLSCSNC